MRSWKTIILVTLGVGAIALVFALAVRSDDRPPSEEGVITVTDCAGRTVSFSRTPERIVLIRSRDIYELSQLLGDEAISKLVAWGPDIQKSDKGAYAKYLQRYPQLADVPVLGSIFEDAVSVEQVLALNPDLVVVETFMSERGYKCIDRMERAGLPLLFLNMSDDPFNGPQDSLLVLGRVLGRHRRAEEIASFVNAEQARVFSRLSRLTGPRPSVYLESGHLGVSRYGNSYGYGENRKLSSWAAVLNRFRCTNIAADVVPNMGPIHPEYLLKSDPDIIIITGAHWTAAPDTMHLGYDTPRAEARQRLRGFANRREWSGLRAVRNGRVYALFHGFCMHGTNCAAFQQLAQWLYPDAFADLKPVETLREFHRRFMPIDYSGTWMIGLEDDE